jgi:hypothetical protein
MTCRFDARLTILHVVLTSESLLASPPLRPDEVIEEMRRTAKASHGRAATSRPPWKWAILPTPSSIRQ